MIFLYIFLIIWLTVLLVYMPLVFYRIMKMYDYAMDLNRRIYDMAIDGINSGKEIDSESMYARKTEMRERYKNFEYLIWRPVSSLYDEDYIFNGDKEYAKPTH